FMVGRAGGAGWPPAVLAPLMPGGPTGPGGAALAVAAPPAPGPAPASAPMPLDARPTAACAAMTPPYAMGVATATIFGTNQQSARKIRDSPTMSSAPMAGLAEVATVWATATQPAESAIPTPIKRNRTMIFTPTPTARAMYFSTYGALQREPPNPRKKKAAATRSEERRVGKECRSRWSPYH